MEAQTLHDEQFAATISELACRHRWNAHTLSGVSVFAVLPAIERNDTYRVANDRLVLQRFYKLLVESLGGRLVRFDTDLSTGDLLR